MQQGTGRRYALPDFATELEDVREMLFKHLEDSTRGVGA